MASKLFVIQITGGREFNIPAVIFDALKVYVNTYTAAKIILRHGGARGADTWADIYGRALGITNIQKRKADWKRYGLAAGNIRNIEMLDEEPIPNVVLAFPDDNSKGTWNMMGFAKDRGIKVELYEDALSKDNKKLKEWNETVIHVGRRKK